MSDERENAYARAAALYADALKTGAGAHEWERPGGGTATWLETTSTTEEHPS